MGERDIFITALEKSGPAEQTAFLEQACGGDRALRRRLDLLLGSHAKAESFLEVPALAQAAVPTCESSSHTTVNPAEDVGRTAVDAALDFLVPSSKPGSLGRLAHYEVLELVGKGGFGLVLKAFDDKLHRVVAIKLLAPHLAASETARRLFVREAQAAAAITHDNVVAIHAVEDIGPVPFLVMQFIDGLSLDERIKKSGPLAVTDIVRISMQIADGLAAAHAQGLVHRDVKPANILLENGVERVKLTDFGLARAVNEAGVTQSGVIAGTPQYMSPEQAEGKPTDQRSDLFSLGSVIYAMSTGRAPFRGESTLAVMKRLCEGTPRPIREVNAEIPEWLTELIRKLHAKDPEQRFDSAAEVAGLLGQHLAHSETRDRVTTPAPIGRSPPRSKHHWKLAAAALLFVIVGLAVTEATGVTHLAQALIRLTTPDGTLVVQIEDPGVKVTVENEGKEVVISGLGFHELRLRGGPHKLHATKDGKPIPIKDDMIEITRGEKRLVKVHREVSVELTTQEKLDRAKKMWEEAGALYNSGTPLRGADPLEAERLLRRALGLYEALVADFPGASKYEQRLRDCRWALGSALHMGAQAIVARGSAAKPEELQRAVALGKESVALGPQDQGFWTVLGWAYYRAGDWTLAEQVLEKAEKLPIASAQVYHEIKVSFVLAMAYWQTGKKERASERFQQASALMEKHGRTDLPLRMLRDEARTLLESASQPSAPVVGDGRLLTTQEKLDQAKKNWDEAVDLYDKGSPNHMRSNDPWEAERLLRRSLTLFEKLASDNPGVTKYTQRIGPSRWALASALNMQAYVVVAKSNPSAEELKHAITRANEAITLQSGGAYWEQLGRARFRTGEWQAAKAAFGKGFAIDKGLTVDWMFMAMTCWHLGEKDVARKWYDQAEQRLRQNPSTDRFLLNTRAEARQMLGIKTDQ